MGQDDGVRSGYVEGERVFGPPSGTFDADWVASAAVATDPALPHAQAQRLARTAWSLLRGGTPAAQLADRLQEEHPDAAGARPVAAVVEEYCALFGLGPDPGSADPYGLQRFVDAQDAGGTYDTALAELRAGRKRTHWMWFVLPQLAGLGRSATAQRYALRGPEEAAAYAAHPVLGPRLVACAEALLALPAVDAATVLGEVDAAKLRSCATLFARVAPQQPVFRALLDRFSAGQEDPVTLALLRD